MKNHFVHLKYFYHNKDVPQVFVHLLLNLYFFLWKLELNYIFLLKHLMVFDLHKLNCLLNHNLILLLMNFYYDDNLRLDNFFLHRIYIGICLLMYIRIFLREGYFDFELFDLGNDDGFLLWILNDDGKWMMGWLVAIFFKRIVI